MSGFAQITQKHTFHRLDNSFYVFPNGLFYIFLSIFFALLQGLPTCCSSLGLSAIRNRLIDYGCWNFGETDSSAATSDCINNNNNNNNNIVKGDDGEHLPKGQPNLTPLHRFYKKQQKTMPGFRSRARLCGCLQVSRFVFYSMAYLIDHIFFKKDCCFHLW